ncbi:hypothetical protein IJJ37_00290 [Candidatus Saccharibacteria bacterium]|nr:hypothetical protein [Candidatus Saccharibacteria bacterium]
MGLKKIKMLSGAASFYIVAFSTLILVIIATSFATVILSEVTRTMNDDLSQSAYDSALAGVEDAKLAYANYRRCVEAATTVPSDYDPATNGDPLSCKDIVYWMGHPDCDMVGHILGRIPKQGKGEVMVSDTVTTTDGEVSNNLNQAYTCVEINTKLNDYRATLSSSSQVRVMKAEFEDVKASEIKAIKLSWYANREGEKLNYNNLTQPAAAWQVTFKPLTAATVATPPTMELMLVQTAESFSFEDVISASSGATTDRATLYLVPTTSADAAQQRNNKTFIGVEQGTSVGQGISDNVISATQVAKTNNREIRNLPFGVWCPENTTADFMCSVTIDLPEPLKSLTNGDRNDDTFMFVVTLPYAQPDTDFAMEFVCKHQECNSAAVLANNYDNTATIRGAQVLIDSTGRANDLYRRVEVRLESSDVSFPYTYYAMELLDTGSTEPVMSKDMTVTEEWNCYLEKDGSIVSRNGVQCE